MKNILAITILLSLFSYHLIAQDNKETRIPLLGETIPSFTAHSTKGNIKFPDDYFGKWKILFSHPSDFTPVCTSELLELAYLQTDFNELNTALLVISTDGLNSHLEWIKSMESIEYKNHKNVKIDFPLISDAGLEISKKLGMLHPYSNSTKDIRGVFIVDPENKIQAMFFYPSTIGRNVEEIKRTLTALQTGEKYSCLTPANWKPGEDVLMPTPQTMDEAMKLRNKKDPNLKEITWYMWLKKK
jgi:peroxiredoxin 2/4